MSKYCLNKCPEIAPDEYACCPGRDLCTRIEAQQRSVDVPLAQCEIEIPQIGRAELLALLDLSRRVGEVQSAFYKECGPDDFTAAILACTLAQEEVCVLCGYEREELTASRERLWSAISTVDRFQLIGLSELLAAGGSYARGDLGKEALFAAVVTVFLFSPHDSRMRTALDVARAKANSCSDNIVRPLDS